MPIRAYLLIAITAFLVAVTGSDLITRMTVGGDSFSEAVHGHLEWASTTKLGIAFLFMPFGVAAIVCGAVNRRSKTRSAATIFFIAMAALAYFYFSGFEGSHHAMLERKWTAAALSIGLLPFFVGIPLSVMVGIAALAAAGFDRRPV
ncbi:hypothetical protein [Rhizorhabdus dicambivorans]|uniref:Uncharacterized protein n=1 Tax=Rhizorhabdus dicambivorans TaxID=1850238 RepID=A0A2A4FZL6_9SPHN|nr:hypothetical protein [Rhizorhabdus dicambivorans]ATE63742.1 hypothetical protein CMV14_04480 [Rhizorhabdus dicambivorans]PCE42872.1 hypothetical protein COO09_08615 [Rhizorhabdus dicambivorans]